MRITRTIPDWETAYPVDPLSINHNSIAWVRLAGASLVPEAPEPLPYNAHLSWDWISRVSCGEFQVDVNSLAFPDPSSFVAGQLHDRLESLVSDSGILSLSTLPHCARLVEKQGPSAPLF